METIDISHTQEIYTVSRLNREVRLLLEGNFPFVWIEGEVSNFAAPYSGHWYFSLKDPIAQVKCAMFKPQNRRLTFTLKDGMHVFIKARISLYEGRGEFQLLAEHIEDAGVGKLQKEFEALKKKLSDQGLFDLIYKKAIPLFPKSIGVITSPTGAAIRDILSVLKRRYSHANIIIYPTLVQGDQAADNIVRALEIANTRAECDVLILTRGGGSIEDLWPFNEEKVAHAIFKSVLPIINGVGHEIDFTIADFVADMRAPTPSAAAELVTPDQNELLTTLNANKSSLLRFIKQRLHLSQQQIAWTKKHLQQQHPKRRLTEQQQRLDDYEMTLLRLYKKLHTSLVSKTENFQEKLFANTPRHLIRDLQHQLDFYQQKLSNSIQQNLQKQKQEFANLASILDALSPLATLKRGFSITMIKATKTILRDTSQVKPGDKIHIELMRGNLECTVEQIQPLNASTTLEK